MSRLDLGAASADRPGLTGDVGGGVGGEEEHHRGGMDVRSFGCEREAYPAADVGRATGDDHHSAFQVQLHPPDYPKGEFC